MYILKKNDEEVYRSTRQQDIAKYLGINRRRIYEGRIPKGYTIDFVIEEYCVYDTKDNDVIVFIGNMYQVCERYQICASSFSRAIHNGRKIQARYRIEKLDEGEENA